MENIGFLIGGLLLLIIGILLIILGAVFQTSSWLNEDGEPLLDPTAWWLYSFYVIGLIFSGVSVYLFYLHNKSF